MTVSIVWQRWLLAAGSFCLAALFVLPIVLIFARSQPSLPTVGVFSPAPELKWFDRNAVRPVDAERDRIEKIAIQEIARRSGTQLDRMQAEAEREGDGWIVFVGFLPAFPGNFCVLRLSESGEIKSITGGA